VRILEKLWRPNPKDLAGGQVVQTRFTANPAAQVVAAASIVFTSAVTCPINTVRILTMYNFGLTGGAAQSPTYTGLQLVSSGAAVFGITQMPPLLIAAAGFWGGNVQLAEGFMLRPGDTLNASAFFSAGAAANTFSIQLYGYDLPIGNVQ
jgi:hypothetical protein